MATKWFVAPEVVTVNLTWTAADGEESPFWIKIKKFLTVGEERLVQTAGWKGVTAPQTGQGGNAEIRIDWRATSFARAEAYLVDWSLEDEKRNRMPLNNNSLQALHPEVFELIENAISAHVTRMDEEKKARAGSRESTPTSA